MPIGQRRNCLGLPFQSYIGLKWGQWYSNWADLGAIRTRWQFLSADTSHLLGILYSRVCSLGIVYFHFQDSWTPHFWIKRSFLLLTLHIESKNTTKITLEFAFVIVFIAPVNIYFFVYFVYCVVICFRCFTQTSFNCGLVSTCKCPLFKLEEGEIWTQTQIYLAQFSRYMAAMRVRWTPVINPAWY